MQTHSNTDDHYLTAEQLCTRYGGVSKMWLRRRIQDSKFPEFVRLGRMRFWSANAIAEWERAQSSKSSVAPPVAQKKRERAA